MDWGQSIAKRQSSRTQRALITGEPVDESEVVETGVDPVTSRFSGARSTN
jgi:hypothetical protein